MRVDLVADYYLSSKVWLTIYFVGGGELSNDPFCVQHTSKIVCTHSFYVRSTVIAVLQRIKAIR